MYRYLLLAIVWLLFSFQLLAQKKKFKLPDTLNEVSGLYIASADSLYWLNDSGDFPRLYLTDAKGELLDTIELPILNIDWEDLTHDDEGNIYIGDFGNNRNNRRDLKIYVFQPQTATLDSIEYVYPDQTEFPPAIEGRNFNMEGFFWFQDNLHLFSKNEIGKGNYFTKHYRLSDTPGTQLLHLQDSLYLGNRVVTGAAINRDQNVAALLTYNFGRFLTIFPFSKVSLFLIRDFTDAQFLKGNIEEQKVRICALASQFEAIDFESNDRVIIASEAIPLYGPKAKRLKVKKRRRGRAVVRP